MAMGDELPPYLRPQEPDEEDREPPDPNPELDEGLADIGADEG
jgi:hypothetical protein